MTVCNMAIEAGARAGLVAVDDKTIQYVKGRPLRPYRGGMGTSRGLLAHPALRRRCAVGCHRHPASGRHRAASDLGHQPEMVAGADTHVPDPEKEKDANKRAAMERALTYMGLEPGKPITDICIDKVFIGSCTNSRIEDLRAAAAVVQKMGQKVANNVKLAMVVPGSGLVQSPGRKRRPAHHLQSRWF